MSIKKLACTQIVQQFMLGNWFF